MKFTDVDIKHPAYKEIDFISDAGIMKGYGDGTFRPAEMITRGTLAIVLARMMGFNKPVTAEPQGVVSLPYNEMYRQFSIGAKGVRYFKAKLETPCTTVSNQLAVTVTTPDASPLYDLVVRRSMNGTQPWPTQGNLLPTDIVDNTEGLGGLAARVKTPPLDTYYIMIYNNSDFGGSFYLNWRCF